MRSVVRPNSRRPFISNMRSILPYRGMRITQIDYLCCSSELLAGNELSELRIGAVRRIPLPRTPLNKGNRKGRSPHKGQSAGTAQPLQSHRVAPSSNLLAGKVARTGRGNDDTDNDPCQDEVEHRSVHGSEESPGYVQGGVKQQR